MFKPRHFITPAVAFIASATLLCALTPPKGFTALFNGTDLSGWHGDNPHSSNRAKDRAQAIEAQQADFQKHWSAQDGALYNAGRGPYATTDKDYGDFELMLEYKTAAKADSGIYLRGNPQVQIWDTTEAGGDWKHGADKGSGGLWNNARGEAGKDPLMLADRPFGEWNQIHIRMIGSRVWVLLNKQLVVDGALMRNYWSNGKTPVPATGPIHLQTHGGSIHWRNIFIREIGAEEANRILSERDIEGFTSMFDGDSFNGWTGDVNQYEIVKGALRSKKGGNLFTEKTYSDFVWRLEFKLPHGGNNGLAIRYPGKGDPAHVGMCELQVIDSPAPKYKEIDPRQHHGSIYGKVAAHRGYLRPQGEWNFQQVRVKGTQVTVELNGTVILDADQAKVTEFMTNKFTNDIPESGHLGFAGHGPGVAFRGLSIRELK